MIGFRQFLNESYVNIIGDDPRKEKYADEVWEILQKSYAPIGGIKGKGFASKEDMIDNIPFWKLNTKNGKVVFVVMYKDKGGRKSVAFGTDGSEEGKKVIADFLKVDMKRSYGEKSKAALGAVLKLFDWEVIEPYLKTPEEASKLLKKEVRSVKNMNDTELPPDGVFTLKKYPKLIDYAYVREIGGNPTFKVMIGTPNLKIR